MNTDKTLLHIKEGPASNYFEALHLKFGGEIDERSYQVNNVATKFWITSYMIAPSLELVVFEGSHNKVIEIDRLPDDDPDYIHFNLFKKGQFTQTYSNQNLNIEAGTTKGAFVYNGMFPLKAEMPANDIFKSVSFKFSKATLEALMPEALDTYDELFGAKEPIAYHMQLPREIERLTDDIFYFREEEFGNQTLVMARGLEAFTSLMLLAKKQVDTHDLRGLHIDDYQRLLDIKDKLLVSFDQKISLEGIANEFGLSVSKLKRDFKTLFDCSIYQFYTHAKMDEAFRLLKTGNYSVMEVGYDLGYQNLSKFSEMFRKVKGISPKEVMSHDV